MCKCVLYQTCIKVGKFGIRIYTKPRRWKWLAMMDVILYCLCKMRETESFLLVIKEGDSYRYGKYMESSSGIVDSIG